jgi:hypothetical protein
MSINTWGDFLSVEVALQERQLSDHTGIAEETPEYPKGWLIDPILESDMALGKYLNARGGVPE